jgi:predicted dinucleotide-binding enzyme
MRIGTLGAGLMAEALAGRWAQQGHEVLVGGRDVTKAEVLGRQIGARAGSLREAAEFGDVLLLAVRWEGIESTLAAAGASDGAIAGKVLIDCTNPVDAKRFTLVTGTGFSIAEQVQEATDARVVKAFNLCQASVWETAGQVRLMSPPRFAGRPLAVPFAGDDRSANDVARALITTLEWEPVEIGPLHRARQLEAMAATLIALAHGGRDPVTAFNLIEQQPAVAASRATGLRRPPAPCGRVHGSRPAHAGRIASSPRTPA